MIQEKATDKNIKFMQKTNIAVIITCFNRCKKTTSCLQHLFNARDSYNNTGENKIRLSIYLTDDGCTDGTAEAVKKLCSNEELHIIQGTGNLFWAGGMRAAWQEAINGQKDWDFFLLLNDDTTIQPNTFTELLNTHKHAIKTNGKSGIYSGVCTDSSGENITYGAHEYGKSIISGSRIMQPTGHPHPCTMTNANILLIASDVVKTIGIFSEEYTHSGADWAYGIEASRKGFPVYITAQPCGICDNDHIKEEIEAKIVIAMNIDERKKYYSSPLHSHHDALIFLKRHQKIKYIILYIIHTFAIYMPRVYFNLLNKR